MTIVELVRRVPNRYADVLVSVGALVGAAAAIWQRLMFDRVLELPPFALALGFWLIFTAFLGCHLMSNQPARRVAALIVALAASAHLVELGLPLPGPGPGLEEYRWRMAGQLSTTWQGLPLRALLAATGVLAWSWLNTASLRFRPLALAFAAFVLLFGGTTVLGYATGSPWPFGV